MNHLDSEQKVSVLLAALEERYRSIHTIRERVQSVGIWALGLLIAAGGWVIQSGLVLDTFRCAFYVLGITCAFVVLRFRYLEDLHNGFRSQQRVVVRLEKALGLFAPGIFDNEASGLYPEKWENAGSESGDGEFFDTTYVLLYVGFTFVTLAIVSAGCWWY